jgi:hypothetical protein
VILTGATATTTNIGTVTANVIGQAAHDAVISGKCPRLAPIHARGGGRIRTMCLLF